jgi:hypothetical protein
VRNGISFILFFLIFSVSFMGGCGTIRQKSVWMDYDITIDGNDEDWHGDMKEIQDKKVFLGVANNDDFLYLILAIRDSGEGTASNYIRSIAAGGLTVSFDPKGGENRAFSIRHPLVMQRGGDKAKPREFESGKPDATGEVGNESGSGNEKPYTEKTGKRDDVKQTAHSVEGSEEALEIIDAKGNAEKRDIPSMREYGFEAKASISRRTFIYELKIPIESKRKTPYSIELADSRVIGIGLEGVEIKDEKKPGGRPGGGGPGGGRPGSGGPRGGGPRGGGPGGGGPGGGGPGGGEPGGGGLGGGRPDNLNGSMEPEGSEKLKVWLKIDLASEKKTGATQK